MAARVPKIGLFFVAICLVSVPLLAVWKSRSHEESTTSATRSDVQSVQRE